jgi:hypothetical protein
MYYHGSIILNFGTDNLCVFITGNTWYSRGYGYVYNNCNEAKKTIASSKVLFELNVTTTQGWDAENRLVNVSGTGMSASFSYDGDGMWVKGTVNGAVTAYIGNWFEWTGSTSTMQNIFTLARSALR